MLVGLRFRTGYEERSRRRTAPGRLRHISWRVPTSAPTSNSNVQSPLPLQIPSREATLREPDSVDDAEAEPVRVDSHHERVGLDLLDHERHGGEPGVQAP